MKKAVILRFSILTVSIFLLCTGIYTFFYSNPERYKVRSEDKKIGDKVEEKDFDIRIEEEINTSSKDTPKVDVPTPKNSPKTTTITYTCPDGYQLNGAKCIMSRTPNLVCPSGTNEYSYNDLSGCINLGEGNISEDGTCPDGFALVQEIHLGSPNITKCFTIYNKAYTCDNEFTLSGSNCIKTIDATKNES